MKLKIGVEIHKEGENNSSVLAMVASNNGGRIPISDQDIIGYIKFKRIERPHINAELSFERAETNALVITEKGEPTISLTWKEVYELEETPETQAIEK
jgi:hypothetical protein